MVYRYETHCHTALGSNCGRFAPDELVEYYRQKGYDGVIITDHMSKGNFPQDMSWEDRVAKVTSGYNAVKKYAERYDDFDVFFAWEYTYITADILTYGLDASWLLSHGDILDMPPQNYLDLVKSEGALRIHAHPFRNRSYINMQILFPDRVDGIEVVNASHPIDTNFDELAKSYAEINGLPKSAGSDAHGPAPRLSGLEFDRRLSSIEDFISSFNSGEGRIFVID